MEEKQLTEIFLKLERMEFQIGRLVSDAESEKEFRKQRNIEVEKRMRELEQWKSGINGRIVATVSIISLIWGALVAIVVKVVT